jgi:two-component system sensor histidine kinase TctE
MLDDTRVRRAAGGESPDGQGPGARFTVRFKAQVRALEAP